MPTPIETRGPANKEVPAKNRIASNFVFIFRPDPIFCKFRAIAFLIENQQRWHIQVVVIGQMAGSFRPAAFDRGSIRSGYGKDLGVPD
jgi:hypothetical protein